MAQPPEYVRYSIYSQRDKKGAYDIPSYEKDLRNIVNNAIKSALPKDAFYHVGERQLAGTGRERIDVFVHRDTADFGRVGKKGESVLEQSLNKIANEITFKGSTDTKYHITKARPVSQSDAETLARGERDKEVAENTKQIKEGFKDARSTWFKIVAVVTTIADITRRILSSLVTMSQEAYKDTITAHNLGVNYSTIRTYKRTEQAHGLKEGTLTQGATDVQSKFGNITALDTKAVDALAVVMGGKVEDMIKVATSEQNPDKAMGMILDSFMERANQGYNSVGQYVGEAQARRELYSYLLKISPAWADIFATMQEEQHNINSLFREQAGTFEGFKNAVPSTIGGHSEAEYNVFKSMAEYTNLIKDSVDKIKESIGVGLSSTIIPLLRRISDTRVGMSETENLERNEANKKANEDFITSAEKTLSAMEGKTLTPEEKAYKAGLEYWKKTVADKNKLNIFGNISNVVPLPDEIVAKGEELIGGDAWREAFYNRKDTEYLRQFYPYIKRLVDVNFTPKKLEKLRSEAERKAKKDYDSWDYFKEQVENDPNSPYYLDPLLRGRGNEGRYSAAIAASKVAFYYGDTWSEADWKEWYSMDAYARMAWAQEKGYVKKHQHGANAPIYTPIQPKGKPSAPPRPAFMFDEEQFYLDLFAGDDNIWSKLADIIRDDAKKSTGNNMYYDLMQLYRGNYDVASGTYNARFFDDNQNGVIVHKIVLDYNNNGRIDEKDLVLESWQNDRPGYTGMAELRFENGRLSAIAPASSEVE